MNQEEPQNTKRRILSIDGGGILGTFPAAFLASLEKSLGQPIGDYFDLIVGTSTGGIIALGLGMGLSAADVLRIYEEDGAKIFGNYSNGLVNSVLNKARSIRQSLRPKYKSDNLKNILLTYFGGRKLGESKYRLVIPAWNPSSRSVYIYKTAHHERLTTDYQSPVIDAALATSAAPTYFQQHLTNEGVGLIDGGIWANNPIAVAVTEAIGLLGWSASDLYVLSLGCLNQAYSLPKAGGIGTLATKLVSLFMSGQSHGAIGMAKLLTGHQYQREAIFRVDHTIPTGQYSMDSVEAISDLKSLGVSYARKEMPRLKPVFFTHPAELFKPIYVLP